MPAAFLNTLECGDGRPVDQVTRKLEVGTPPARLVDAYLSEIAKGYGVAWSPPKPEGSDEADDGGPDGGVKVSDCLLDLRRRQRA